MSNSGAIAAMIIEANNQKEEAEKQKLIQKKTEPVDVGRDFWLTYILKGIMLLVDLVVTIGGAALLIFLLRILFQNL